MCLCHCASSLFTHASHCPPDFHLSLYCNSAPNHFMYYYLIPPPYFPQPSPPNKDLPSTMPSPIFTIHCFRLYSYLYPYHSGKSIHCAILDCWSLFTLEYILTSHLSLLQHDPCSFLRHLSQYCTQILSGNLVLRVT